MANSRLSIEMLPALHGDALWVEWGDDDDRRLLLIDGGPMRTFDTLAERFLKMDQAAKRVELMVVTHIDLDHIEGAIKLLRTTELGIEYNDVWFNDYHHLDPDAERTRGAKQGEYLGAVVENVELPVNKAFGGKTIVVPPTGTLPRVKLPGGLELVLISPSQEKLTALQKVWKRTLDKAGMTPGDREDALARLDNVMKPADLSRGGRKTFGKDSSKPNGSSIGFIAEYKGERWLLAGDAHADVLVTNLKRYGQEVGETKVRLDGFKLPHHGSTNNMSAELLSLIDCRRFLISTNGDRFKHPDRACIDLIIGSANRPHLIFNYLSDFTKHWEDDTDVYTSQYLDQADPDDRAVLSNGSVPSTDGPDPAGDGSESEATKAEDAEPESGDEEPPTDGSPESEESEARSEGAGPEEAMAGSTSSTETTARGADGVASNDAPEDPGFSEDGRAPLDVSVHHASLDTADHPVLVGHYIATPLSGAEGFIDRRFDGRLSERVGQGQYPGAIGQSLHITGPRRRPPTEGALIVGLGEYGDLTPLLVVETVRSALVDHALDEANRRDSSDIVALGITSVLLGATGDQGMSIAASVRAIVDGVRQANHSLRSGDGTMPRAQFRNLQIFERNAPEAELAFLALQDLPGSEGEFELDVVNSPTELTIGEGALTHSLPVDAAEASWWRVRVSDVTPEREDGQPGPYLELEFAVGGRLARVGNVIHRVERRRLERLLSTVVGEPMATKELRTTLFELLFPNQLKWDLTGAQDVQLEVDDRTADIPWEMLEARNPQRDKSGEFALRAKLVRQFKLPSLPTIRRAAEPRALVIGNPPTGHLAPDLPGAADEAEAVANKLGGPVGNYRVEHHIYHERDWADPDIITTIETALLAHDYRIIHIAGHGFFQPDEPTRTGVAIGPDDFITAQMLNQLIVTPDVVFLNCCHVGQVGSYSESGSIDFTRKNYHRLSASLARQLIDSGVRAVVVAGWAVSDVAAKVFAETFYHQLLDGQDFSSAVHDARMAAQSTDESSTWGAYQCYGDGSYRLPEEAKVASGPPEKPRTPREVMRRLESLVSRIESVGADDQSKAHQDRAAEEITILQETAENRGWTEATIDGKTRAGAGRLCEEIAKSWGAIGEFGIAVHWYRKALDQDDGEMTLRGLEMLANLEDRWAAQIIKEHRLAHPDADQIPIEAEDLLSASKERIKRLEALSGTAQRKALRAGAQKRQAAANDGSARQEALTESITAYLDSYQESDDSYTLFNYVQLEEIRSRRDADASAAEPQLADVKAKIAANEEMTSSERDYWSAVALADGELTVAIADDTVDDNVDHLAELYRIAFDSRSTARQRNSTIEHIEDLAELHPDSGQAEALLRLKAKLIEPVDEEQTTSA